MIIQSYLLNEDEEKELYEGVIKVLWDCGYDCLQIGQKLAIIAEALDEIQDEEREIDD